AAGGSDRRSRPHAPRARAPAPKRALRARKDTRRRRGALNRVDVRVIGVDSLPKRGESDQIVTLDTREFRRLRIESAHQPVRCCSERLVVRSETRRESRTTDNRSTLKGSNMAAKKKAA